MDFLFLTDVSVSFSGASTASLTSVVLPAFAVDGFFEGFLVTLCSVNDSVIG